MFDIVGADMSCFDFNIIVEVFPKPGVEERVSQSSWQ